MSEIMHSEDKLAQTNLTLNFQLLENGSLKHAVSMVLLSMLSYELEYVTVTLRNKSPPHDQDTSPSTCKKSQPTGTSIVQYKLTKKKAPQKT